MAPEATYALLSPNFLPALASLLPIGSLEYWRCQPHGVVAFQCQRLFDKTVEVERRKDQIHVNYREKEGKRPRGAKESNPIVLGTQRWEHMLC